MNTLLPTISLIDTPVATRPFEEQVETIVDWALHRESRTVCLANVHMLIEGYRRADFGHLLKRADLIAPDGMPLVWLMRALGVRQPERVAGMDVFLDVCDRASKMGLRVFFLGSQSVILDLIKAQLSKDFPDLVVAGMRPLPMISSMPEVDECSIQAVNESKADIVFLSLGCPKQERWMDIHRRKIEATMLGVGGIFPIYAGVKRMAPLWMRRCGLEWLYRWQQEPRRLAKRYLSTNPVFIWLAIVQVLHSHLSARASRPWNRSLEN